MACEQWRDKLDAYVDSELSSSETSALAVHMRECASCAADALQRVQLKRSVAAAGRRYEPTAEFREKIRRSVACNPRVSRARFWIILGAPALLLLILSVTVSLFFNRENARQQRVYSELADLHVATLASATPVDVISTDRHTVKPWFEGKIPFTFNLPEVQGTDFILVGGRVAYLGQTPGAHLIYRIRNHEISVFVFQDRTGDSPSSSGPMQAFSFNVESWTRDGLRCFVFGDVNADDIDRLAKLWRDAG